MPQLAALGKANAKHIFGTKMPLCHQTRPTGGIQAVVNRILKSAGQIIAAGLMPSSEPEVDIHCRRRLKPKRCSKKPSRQVTNCQLSVGMLKLTLPGKTTSTRIFRADIQRFKGGLRLIGGWGSREVRLISGSRNLRGYGISGASFLAERWWKGYPPNNPSGVKPPGHDGPFKASRCSNQMSCQESKVGDERHDPREMVVITSDTVT